METVVILRGVQFINEWYETAYVILTKLWKNIISTAENAWDNIFYNLFLMKRLRYLYKNGLSDSSFIL